MTTHRRILSFAAIWIALPAFAGNEIDENLLRFAEQRGVEIWARDSAAWLATDAVTIERLQGSKVIGWVTERADDVWLVKFIGECGKDYCSKFDVEVDLENQVTDVTHHTDPTWLDGKSISAWKARQLAFSSEFRPCSNRYNTVVIEGVEEGEFVWIVYLLAATTDPNLVVLGGHHRVTVSADGSEIVRNEPLTNACLSFEINPDAVGMTMRHLIDPEPIETHVFSSLHYQAPIYVATSSGIFKVEGGQIRFVEAR